MKVMRLLDLDLIDCNSLCIEVIHEVVGSGEARPPVCNLHEIFEYILYEFNRLLFGFVQGS